MYSRTNDKRIPAEISIPENYRGNVFSSGCHATGCPTENADNGQYKNGLEQSKECSCDDGCDDCRNEEHKAESSFDKQGSDNRCGDCQNDCAPKDLMCEDKEKNKKNDIFNIGIGAEELLILGVMALVFFSGDSRDNELLVCLLLVLLI